MQVSHYLPHSCDVIKPLQSEPEAFGTGFTITVSSEEPSKTGNHPDSFPKRRCPIRCYGILGDVSCQGFPLGLFKENCTGHIRCFTTKFGKMKNAPRNHQINSKTGLDTICMTQLPISIRSLHWYSCHFFWFCLARHDYIICSISTIMIYKRHFR